MKNGLIYTSEEFKEALERLENVLFIKRNKDGIILGFEDGPKLNHIIEEIKAMRASKTIVFD